jgi:hypothetical protein
MIIMSREKFNVQSSVLIRDFVYYTDPIARLKFLISCQYISHMPVLQKYGNTFFLRQNFINVTNVEFPYRSCVRYTGIYDLKFSLV